MIPDRGAQFRALEAFEVETAPEVEPEKSSSLAGNLFGSLIKAEAVTDAPAKPVTYESYAVIGAGRLEINGIYHEQGEYCGHPIFVQDRGPGIMYWSDTWKINSGDSEHDWIYDSGSDGMPPPGLWNVRSFADGPAPVLQRGGSQAFRKRIRFIPEQIRGVPVVVPTEDADLYLIDNSVLQSSRAGVQFRLSRNLDDKDCMLVPYGDTIRGKLVTGWLELEFEAWPNFGPEWVIVSESGPGTFITYKFGSFAEAERLFDSMYTSRILLDPDGKELSAGGINTLALTPSGLGCCSSLMETGLWQQKRALEM